ncbi:AMP-binding protein [Endozoicomonas sp. SM1973]|uniref:AMP-binding protein n=1 Tax=Spartinivicinus marinus TaxID=2994442 RepID=A0A853I3U9_9GAMM|nr:AMP-binding protein [Spartinivicinus marinus]MCX4026807.1 AMP-binding protein [Spartinivicinus marinus]NYZ64641.1 AMP-binding protein [Spartinivicinus marinus]
MTGEFETERHELHDGTDDNLAPALLRIAGELVEELHPHQGRLQHVTLDCDLDRDLGLDSLGRAELILRLDRAFKVHLPDELLSSASSLQDMLAALKMATPGTRRWSRDEIPISLPQINEPITATTLLDVLCFHATTHPQRPHLKIWQSEALEQSLTYGALHKAALKIAKGLVEHGLEPGSRVAMMLATQPEFFESFFGILYAGGVPVPLYPPFKKSQVEDHLRRQASILANAEATILIVDNELRGVGTLLFGLVASLQHISTVDGLTDKGCLDVPILVNTKATALIQYTSGSTGDPKGVVLTHANLLANIRAMGDALEASSTDVFVSWLPLYHDMGLIGAWLGSLYLGALAVIMSPLAFLAKPSRWLHTISLHRGTLSVAPNFAFELCCKSMQGEDMEGLDLSSLRIMLNGAEPVSAATIDRFSKRFAPYGFRPEVMMPVYGLAENSVGLAFPPLKRIPIVDYIERTALTHRGIAVQAASEDSSVISIVACGRPLAGHQIRIVDDSGAELPDRVQGRLQFKGPSATTGYFRNQAKTSALLSGDWLESGDLAYMVQGDVYVTGRVKDIIIKAGRNIYPHEIEEAVGQLEGVRKGCVAAVASADPRSGTEQLVLVVETHFTDETALAELRQAINEACAALLDVSLDVVELVPPRTIPKTSSGKIRRAATKELYETGVLRAKPKWLWLQLFALVVSGLGKRARRSGQHVWALLYAGYWWLVLGLAVAVVWGLVMALPVRRWRHFVVHTMARLFFCLVGIRLRLKTERAIPKERVILVANHSSYLDSLVISATISGEITFVAKAELSKQAFSGPFLRRLGVLFAHRTEAAGGVEDTKRQCQAARAGERIISFPEGTLTRMPGLLAFHLGAFHVAAQENLPVVPITIGGTRSILRDGQWFPHRCSITVEIAEPVMPDGSDFAASVRLRDAVRAVMLERCGEPDLAKEQVLMPSPPSNSSKH